MIRADDRNRIKNDVPLQITKRMISSNQILILETTLMLMTESKPTLILMTGWKPSYKDLYFRNESKK